MLQMMLLLANVPPTPTPVISGVVVSTLTAGACSGGSPTPPASIDITWTETSVNRATHRVDIYENGVLMQSGLTNNHKTKTITGYVEGGFFSPFTSNWTYTVKLVRLSDNAVVSSAVSSAWVTSYGACS